MVAWCTTMRMFLTLTSRNRLISYSFSYRSVLSVWHACMPLPAFVTSCGTQSVWKGSKLTVEIHDPTKPTRSEGHGRGAQDFVWDPGQMAMHAVACPSTWAVRKMCMHRLCILSIHRTLPQSTQGPLPYVMACACDDHARIDTSKWYTTLYIGGACDDHARVDPS
jgi:hypothetical protein